MNIPPSTHLTNKFATSRCSVTGERIRKGEPMFYCRAAPHGKRCRSIHAGPHPFEDRKAWATGAAPAGKPDADSGAPAALPNADTIGGAIDWDSIPENTAGTAKLDEPMGLSSVISFDSPESLLRYLQAEKPAAPDAIGAANRVFARSLWSNPRAWNNNTDLAALKHRAANPPESSLAKIEAIKDEIESNLYAPAGLKRVRRRRLDSGDEVDIFRALDGEPDCWSDMRRTVAHRPIVRIGVNGALSASEDTSVGFYRGAAIAALSDALNTQGFAVEVFSYNWARDSMRRGKGGSVVRVRVQRPDKPQSLAALASALADIGFTRVGVFSASALSCRGEVCEGLGSPLKVFEAERAQFAVFADQEVRDLSSAVKFVRDSVDAVLSGADHAGYENDARTVRG